VSDGATSFALQSLGGEPFVAVSVGHAFQVFEAGHLRVVAVSERTRRAITSLATKGDRTFVGCGPHLSVWERLHPLATLGKHKGSVVGQVVLGDVLVSVCSKGLLKAWDLQHPSLVGRKHRQQRANAPHSAPPAKSSVEEDSSDEEGGGDGGGVAQEPACTAAVKLGVGFEEPTCLAHPDTYLNKVVVGSKAGKLGLWNFRTGKKVHEFAALAAGSSGEDSGGGWGGVTALEPSPALDVCAVGFSQGAVVLLHLKADAVLFAFRAASPSPCRSLSFRTDGGFAAGTTAGGSGLSPTLASGHGDGRVWVWGLAQQQLLGEVNAPLPAHGGGSGGGGRGILRVAFLPKEPVLLTLGADNALKAWIFDGPLLGAASSSGASAGTAGSRLLRSREVHTLPAIAAAAPLLRYAQLITKVGTY
jgi:U3 small nucleolar RNA-associated protein 21